MSLADASENITFPFRCLIVGRAQSGKTTEFVRLFCKTLHKSLDRIIIVCPTFLIQDTYLPMRSNPAISAKIHPEDIHTKQDKNLFDRILLSIKNEYDKAKLMGVAPKRSFVLVDDLAGESLIHNNRKGSFSNFSVACTHWKTSMFVITQSPMAVDPAFRENCEGIIVFQSEGIYNVEWLRKSYQSLAMREIDMKAIIEMAWRGGRSDNSEWGKHFLFIFAEPRKHTRFFIDFKEEILFD